MAQRFPFEQAPGFLIRRAHQIAVALFMEEAAAFETTPVQFGLLSALIDAPGMDQVTLAERVALDVATAGSALGRLESKGLVRRDPDPGDRRRRLVRVTPEGARLAASMRRAAERAQGRMLARLPSSEQKRFLDLIAAFVLGASDDEDSA
ncbi:MAG: MarR family transcriptional regulator [Burkholderiales bacterium]